MKGVGGVPSAQCQSCPITEHLTSQGQRLWDTTGADVRCMLGSTQESMLLKPSASQASVSPCAVPGEGCGFIQL